MKRRIPAVTWLILNLALLTSPAWAQTGPRLPAIYWTSGIGHAQALKAAGIEQLAVPPAQIADWQKAGFKVLGVSRAELARRRKLAVPRLAGRGANVASATRRPWIDANGWTFTRRPRGKFYYDLPGGKAAMAAAEAYAYGADALLKIAQEDIADAGRMLAFLRQLPALDLPVVADFAVVDNRSKLLDEVLNLLTRRNLLYTLVPAPSPRYSLNIRLGTPEFPDGDAADPSAFAQMIRQRIGDDNRSLRLYGTEIVICRLTGDDSRVRLHLINYSGREADSLRIKVRGQFGPGEIRAFGVENPLLEEIAYRDGATEFTISKMGLYAVIDLPRK